MGSTLAVKLSLILTLRSQIQIFEYSHEHFYWHALEYLLLARSEKNGAEKIRFPYESARPLMPDYY